MEMIAELKEMGIEVAIEENRLRFTPEEKITPDLLSRIKANKKDIVRALRQAQETNPAFCSWLKATVEQCQLPCWVWSKDKGNGRTCEHFRRYMNSIGRW